MEKTVTSPTIRVRTNFTNTQKEGWRLAETTVELTMPLGVDDGLLPEQMKYYNEMAHDMGFDEAERRNRAEGRL